MTDEPATKRRRLSPSGNAFPGFVEWDLERDYQQKLQRKKDKKDGRRQKLPIKTDDGWLEQHAEEPEIAGRDDRDSDEEELKDQDSGVAGLDRQSAIEDGAPRLSHKEQIIRAKEELAKVAGQISESPEGNIGLLKTLAQIADTENAAVQKLALATQLAVYKDVIPGYRIRPIGKEDMQAKVSKDVKKLRNFEQSLLGAYREYVNGLARFARNSGVGNARTAGVSSVAIGCACELVKNVPHFNLRNDLVAILVQKLASRRLDADFTKCREAVEHLFREDEDGHHSLETVSQLTKMMKAKSYNVQETVLNTFLNLRLLTELNVKASTTSIDKLSGQDQQYSKMKKKDREFRTKKERKHMRERKNVEKEMREADASVSFEERDKNQAETLKLVFVAYFRILKAKSPLLMGAVLEGLASYSHLINQDFFGDILEALKDLIAARDRQLSIDDEEQLEIEGAPQQDVSRQGLLCVITAFALLHGQQDVTKQASLLHLDLNFFITHLYNSLLPVSLDPNIELSAKTQHLADPNGLTIPSTSTAKVNVATTSVLLIRSLSSTLLPPTNIRAVPPSRIAAYTKALMTASLHLPQKSAQAVLGLVRQVAKVHGKKIAALWNTEERKGDGVFDALSTEIEASNPFAATIWEGELLKRHFDPRIVETASKIELNIRSTGE